MFPTIPIIQNVKFTPLPLQHYQSFKLLSACYLPATLFIASCLVFKSITIFADRISKLISNNIIIQYINSELVESRINTTFNGQPYMLQNAALPFLQMVKQYIVLTCNRTILSTPFIQVLFPFTVNETSAVWQQILQCTQSDSN